MLGAVVDAYNKSVPINTEREDKKTKLNLNNKNILLHRFITFPEGVYGGKGGKHGTFLIWTYGKKVGNLDFRGKVGNLDFWDGGGTSDLDLGKKVGNWDFWDGGYSVTSDLDLGEKVGNLDFWDGGVFCNFGFGLRKKLEIWIFGMWGGIL